jgi:hypothetical protein
MLSGFRSRPNLGPQIRNCSRSLKSLTRVGNSVEIWPAAVARVSRRSASPRRDNFAHDNGSPRNIAKLVLYEQVVPLFIYGKYWRMRVNNILFCWS